ncbi:MAG: hypothetical protein C3F07_11970 [Anaerolineales bacterium]|nr:hypothetical protein [Anaerolineae bacterium]PWB72405.1 MAG: hypothetical protein C3F07_11970 [Anaerolineales bacterium]
MSTEALDKFWPLVNAIVGEIWGITEPRIEDAAVKNNVPIELYLYSELGLEYFSVEEFQKRDPFSNTEQFETMFARFDVKGWIFPTPEEHYQVSERAREAVRGIIQVGDAHLARFKSMPDAELKQLLLLLKQIVMANLEAPEPPEKWAVYKRFRVADDKSPLIVRVRELLLDLFAYRDDSYLSAARPHFGQAGIVWNVLHSVWSGDATTAEQMAETMSFRGFAAEEYEVAIQAAVEIGWIEPADVRGSFRPTQKGGELREQVEKLTDEYFYRPWSVLTQDELDALYQLLTRLREQLSVYYRSVSEDGHV